MVKHFFGFLNSRKFFFVLGASLSFSAFSQNQNTQSNWVNYAENDGIKFSYQSAECNGQSVVFLKFENTTTAEVNLNFQLILDGNQVDVPTPNIIHLRPLEITAGQCVGTPFLIKNSNGSNPKILTFRMNIIH